MKRPVAVMLAVGAGILTGGALYAVHRFMIRKAEASTVTTPATASAQTQPTPAPPSAESTIPAGRPVDEYRRYLVYLSAVSGVPPLKLVRGTEQCRKAMSEGASSDTLYRCLRALYPSVRAMMAYERKAPPLTYERWLEALKTAVKPSGKTSIPTNKTMAEIMKDRLRYSAMTNHAVTEPFGGMW